ncbi:MAG: rhodanese-like domain-containing protein, partial [Ignavibacteriales bacterium]|nr:rhodanese-like domain-containing protein [Ignavibacteriales bacterium]
PPARPGFLRRPDTDHNRKRACREEFREEVNARILIPSKTIYFYVRTTEEVTGPMPKLKQAIHIPLHELSSRVKELSKFKDREIAVICRSGNRSRAAVNILVENGYKAKNVPGGMSAYTRQ